MEAGAPAAGLAGGHADLVAGLCRHAVTVVRLPLPAGANPPERVISTVARVDLSLADLLHDEQAARPYAVACRLGALDVVCCRDDLARALLAGEPAARLVLRVRPAAWWGDPPRAIRVAFLVPTLFRVAGLDHLLPDSRSVFDSLRVRWLAAGWPPLPEIPCLARLPCWPETLAFRTRSGADGRPVRGLVGVVRYDLAPASPRSRLLLALLARFGEYRGVGRLTSYGFGRIRLLAPGERWADGMPAVWEPRV